MWTPTKAIRRLAVLFALIALAIAPQGDRAAIAQCALELREKGLGPQHPSTATALSLLATLYGSTGNYNRAESLYLRALTIYENALGPEHSFTATTLNNLAGIYDSMANYAKAESLLLRALKIQEKAFGPEHQSTA